VGEPPLAFQGAKLVLSDLLALAIIIRVGVYPGSVLLQFFLVDATFYEASVFIFGTQVANLAAFTGFGFVAISSNDVANYPQDHPDKMADIAEEENYPFPYLYDETQDIAKAYDAACTPDFYVFDENQELFYRGQLDDSRPKNGLPLTGRSLREALDALLNNREIPKIQKPSLGCGIKWKTS
jgi:hypothetical protein